MNRVLCESKCRARCVFERSREDVEDRTALRGPTKVRMGGVDIAVPELNFPITRLAKAAVQLRAPLAAPVESKSSSVDLRPELARRGVGIEDQKDTPTCMAHALTSAMEFALSPVLRGDPSLARSVGVASAGVELSRRHAHFASLHAAVVCQRDNPRGSWALHAASAIAAEGTFEERLWPWAPWDPTSARWKTCEEAVNGGHPSSKALASRHFFIDAFKYLPPFGLEAAASARAVGDLEGILDQGHPIVLAVILFPSAFDAAWRNGGHVHTPKAGAKTSAALHYVLVVGFDRAKKYFLFANSWGRGFGSRGYGYLDYDYVANHAIEGLFVEKMKVVP
jgi:Papain family cysteine protease